jgi:hypothetical protein
MGNGAGPGATNFFKCQLDPQIQTLVAVVKGGDRPGHLGAFRVVSRMVVSAVICELLHGEQLSTGYLVDDGGENPTNRRLIAL